MRQVINLCFILIAGALAGKNKSKTLTLKINVRNLGLEPVIKIVERKYIIGEDGFREGLVENINIGVLRSNAVAIKRKDFFSKKLKKYGLSFEDYEFEAVEGQIEETVPGTQNLKMTHFEGLELDFSAVRLPSGKIDGYEDFGEMQPIRLSKTSVSGFKLYKNKKAVSPIDAVQYVVVTYKPKPIVNSK